MILDDLDDWFEHHSTDWGIAIEIIIITYCFFALAIVCDDYLAPALETLCVKWGIREDVAGATFLAFGSAAPEIVVNAVATVKSASSSDNTTSLGISAIIGSGMIAFSFIPSMCAFTSELPLYLKRRPLFRDELFYSIALFLLCWAFHDGKIQMYEGLILVGVYFAFLGVVVTSGWIRARYRFHVKGIALPKREESFVHKVKKQLEEHRSKSSLKKSNVNDGSFNEPMLSGNKHRSMDSEISQENVPVSNGKNNDSINSSPVSNNNNSKANLLANTTTGSKIKILDKANSSSKIYNSSSYRQLGDEDNTEIQINNNNNDEGSDSSFDDDYDSDKDDPSKIFVNTDGTIQNTNPNEETNENVENDDLYDSDEDPLAFMARKRTLTIGSDDSENEIKGWKGIILKLFTVPLKFIFSITCPPAGEGEKCENLYFLTFWIAIFWVAVFSYLLSSIVAGWVNAWHMPQALFGMLLIAIGAEIPDTIESVTMARKGYGSMAVANCQGTQVINIGIGLGLPWVISNLVNGPVEVNAHGLLQVGAFFQAGIVAANIFSTLGVAIIQKKNKAYLSKNKAIMLCVGYVCVLISYAGYLFSQDCFRPNKCGNDQA